MKWVILVLSSSLVAFLTAYILTPYIAEFNRRRGYVAPDVHKPGTVYVPEMGGISIVVSVTIAMLYAVAASKALDVPLDILKLTVLYSSFILTALVGLVDDIKGLGARAKTLATSVAALPLAIAAIVGIVKIGYLRAPFVKYYRITLLYWLLMPLISAGPANAVNMLDIANGVMPATSALIVFPMLVRALLDGNITGVTALSILLATLLGYYPYNRYPAKVFNGDVGSLSVGAYIGVSCVLFRLETVAFVAMLPHIINGLSTIASVKGLKERREIPRPVKVVNGVLYAVKSRDVPITLAGLLLLKGPMTELELIRAILVVQVTSTALAILTALLMGW